MTSKKTKYYAVKKGRKPGIYNTWDECLIQVQGYTGAVYKSFKTLNEAQEYLKLSVDEIKANQKANSTTKTKKQVDPKVLNKEIENKYQSLPNDEVMAFVDGTYVESSTGKQYCGYGVVILLANNEKITHASLLNKKEYFQYRNVYGEIEASKLSILWAIKHKKKRITVYFDYEGIRSWANQKWKANNELSQSYVEFIKTARVLIDIDFVKITSHTGIKYNEEADRLAASTTENI